MTTTTMREKLHDYINDADDKKIASIYALFEDQIGEPTNWYEDDAFLAELEDRVKRYEDGTDQAYSVDEVKASLIKAIKFICPFG